MSKGITENHQWRARMYGVDFLRNDGGPYGVKLIMTADQAKRFSENIKRCTNNADKFGHDKIQVDVHWGRKAKRGAFLITTKLLAGE